MWSYDTYSVLGAIALYVVSCVQRLAMGSPLSLFLHDIQARCCLPVVGETLLRRVLVRW